MMEQESHTMNVELLINKVRENKTIYDASDRNHSNRNFIASVWRKIGEELRMPGEQLKEKWHQLRSNYMRAKRRGKHKPSASGARPKSTWPYFELSFLDPSLESRSTSGNVAFEQQEVLFYADHAEHMSEKITPDIPCSLVASIQSGCLDASIQSGCLDASIQSGCLDASIQSGCLDASIQSGCLDASIQSGCLDASIQSGCLDASIQSGCLDASIQSGCLDASIQSGCLDASIQSGCLDASIQSGCLDASIQSGCLDASIQSGCLDASIQSGCLDASIQSGCLDDSIEKELQTPKRSFKRKKQTTEKAQDDIDREYLEELKKINASRVDETDPDRMFLLKGSCPEKWEEIGSTIVPASIIQLKYHWDQVYCALSNGSVIIFHRDGDGQWQLQDPTIVTLDQEPVTCLLPLGLTMYCASGSKVWVVDSITAEVQRNYSIQHDNEGQAYLLAHSGTGLWIALKNSATICLYHTETFRHLQDINIAANVNRILAGKDKDKSPHTIYVTSLVACKGLLWVGTNVGILLTVPLPRLEGVPIITGRVSLAFHAHQGPVQLLLSLQPKALSIPVLASPVARRPASADGDEESLVSPRTRVIKQISDSVLPSSVSNKKLTGPKTNLSDIHASGAKTLPRGMSLCPHISPQGNTEESNDVYGLYADLMNVQDYEKDSQEKLYERLNHSDPELVHFHLNTLDRRVQQKSGRPRSWDLSTMAVSEDSDSSAAYDTASTATSTATTEISMPSPESTCDEVHSPVQKISDESRSLPTHVTLGRTVYKSAPKTVTDSAQKTVLMLTGGCGYTNWRKLEKDHDSKSSLDAHVMIWEVKL
ncbi:rho guanine nucleotide exchange factor 10 [Trichonephila clavata]|uniref:Rho guanine nucleotide exchange factor 10 n=1 Tax=Trichonephila clavata TaxID=2740835 RepID=A0A8X6ITW2_TRICU|nr:rho guanine nucleotide exchange factor 10 [Trichonephila clavata]